MYKLVAIGGKIRGEEIILHDGTNILGRSTDVDHQFDLEGISKKHVAITVNKQGVFVEDLNSSNGTFVNGELVKKMTIKNNDKIALPNVIFQLVYVEEKKVIVKKKIINNEADPLEQREIMPKDLIGKIKYLFRNKVMPIIYGFNEQYEWRILVAILFFIFVVINIFLTIAPVLLESRRLIMEEVTARGIQYAEEVSRHNAAALNRRDLDRIDTSFLDSAEGILSYELFDLEGRIVRPQLKLNNYINDPFSVDAAKFYKSSGKTEVPWGKIISSNHIGIAKAIKAFDVKTGRSEIVGIIAIHFTPSTLTVASKNSSKAYLEALSTSALVALVFLAIFYYLTTKHISDLKNQIELVLRGKEKELSSPLLMEEVRPLRNSINSILQRIRELQQDESNEFVEIEEDAPYVRRLYEFMQGAGVPVLILNSEKTVSHISLDCEDLIGMRESSSIGTSLLDTMRDQGLAATIIDLCDQSANNDGVHQEDEYEIGGRPFNVSVVSLIGKDSFAKGFYITFNDNENV